MTTLRPRPTLLQAYECRLIQAIEGCVHVSHLKRVHAHLLRAGLHHSNYLLSKLLRRLTSLGVPVCAYARPLFDAAPQPNSFLYTALIRAYALQGPASYAFLLYTHMRSERHPAPPLSFTFSALIKAAAASLDAGAGAQVHAQVIALGGFGSDLYVNNTLLDMYIKCGVLEDARRVFDDMPLRDVISWTAMVVGYVKSGNMTEAEELFELSPDKDVVAWTSVVIGHAQNGRPRNALRQFERMLAARIQMDEVTMVGVISACSQLGALSYGQWIYDVARQIQFDKSVVVASAMVDMFGKCGSLDLAWEVFDAMVERNVFSYSSMIMGFAMHGHAQSAIGLFLQMMETETLPNDVTFIGVLTACSHAGYVDQGRQYFALMQEQYGITPRADHYACMVDLLGRAGHVEEAYELILNMPAEVKPHGGVWGALLGACRIHSRPQIAEAAARVLFQLEPTEVGNYLVLSNIYAAVGDWQKVARTRKLMRERGLRKNPGCSWVEGMDGVVHEFFAGDRTHPKYKEIMAVLDELMEKAKQVGYAPVLSSCVYDVSDGEKMQLLKGHSEKLAVAFGMIGTSQGSSIRISKNLRICEDCHSFMRAASKVTGRKIIIRDNLRFHHFAEGICSCAEFW